MRLIDADALQKTLFKDRRVTLFDGTRLGANALLIKHETVYNLIEEAPTVDAEPVRYGEWVSTEINHREGTQRTSCTVCGFSYYGMALNDFKRCPDYGSKMKEALTDDA